jgi:hypothetical protein
MGSGGGQVFTDAAPLVAQLRAAAVRADAWGKSCCEAVHPGGAATAVAAAVSGRLGAELAAAIAMVSGPG